MNCSKNNRYEVLQRCPQPFYPKDVNVVDVRGNTPLYYAARHGNMDICKFLIEKGALLNFQCECQNTAFHMVFLSGRLDLCLYLFEKGADPNLINVDGQTPLAFGTPTLLKSLGLMHGVAYTKEKDGEQSFDNTRLFLPANGNSNPSYSMVTDLASIDHLTVRQRSLNQTHDRREFVN